MPDHLADTPSDQAVVLTRIFDARREAVFRAWTDPKELAAWFGPGGMEVPSDRITIDLRVGGRFELTMLRPDGGAFTIGYDIVELDEPALLVLRSDPMPQMGMAEPTIVRVEFHDHGPKTRLTLTDAPQPHASHAEAGWTVALEALATHLA